MIVHTNIYDFLEAIDEQVFVGVDALTYTGKSPLAMIGCRALIEEAREQLDGKEMKPFRINGAEGFSMGSLRFATKKDNYGKSLWSIVMLTGPMASKAVKWKVLDLKCTRVDFRVDIVLKQQVKDLAEKLYKISGEQGKVISSLVGSTFYPALSREGTYYGRVYDKSAEYGEDFGWVWRWEIEVKRQAAESIMQTLTDCHDPNQFIEDTVFGVFSENWSIPTPKPGSKPTVNYVGASVVSPEQKLDWVRRNVARSVRELKRGGFSAELEQLFAI